MNNMTEEMNKRKEEIDNMIKKIAKDNKKRELEEKVFWDTKLVFWDTKLVFWDTKLKIVPEYNPENPVKYCEAIQEILDTYDDTKLINNILVTLFKLERIDETLNNNADWFDYINCHAYALGLTDNAIVSMAKKILDSQSKKGGNLIESSFISDLIIKKKCLTEILDQDKPETGNIIIYFKKGKITHSGIIREGKVESKWGILGVFRHDLLQVPSSYGSDIRCYKLLKSPNELTEILKNG